MCIRDSNYVDIFIEKVKELDIENNYKYMSLDLKVMEELESKAPQLETGYIIDVYKRQYFCSILIPQSSHSVFSRS